MRTYNTSIFQIRNGELIGAEHFTLQAKDIVQAEERTKLVSTFSEGVVIVEGARYTFPVLYKKQRIGTGCASALGVVSNKVVFATDNGLKRVAVAPQHCKLYQ
jgi:hypothetical protein